MSPSRRLALLLPLLLLGCSGSDPVLSIEETNFASSLGVDLAASTKTASGVYYRDIVVGPGAVVAAGQQLTVHYSGWLPNGTLFDSNVAGQTPFPFQLGTGAVIQGWDLGVPGMHVGGQRQLIIPPALGYGVNDYGPIPGNSILVFRVEIVSAQ
jgi:FKBP-type peptidyl-prolyl cis-trans isomerase FkpA